MSQMTLGQDARVTAASICALVSEDRTKDAEELLTLFMHQHIVDEEAHPMLAMNSLLGAVIGVAVASVRALEGGADVFRDVAEGLLMNGGEW